MKTSSPKIFQKARTIKFYETWQLQNKCQKKFLVIWLLVLSVIFGGRLQLFAEAGDVLFGENAPSLDTSAPELTTFQLGNDNLAEKTGAATYSYPIKVPPGRNGLEPNLSLSYPSPSPLRGGLAAGWDLALPMIQIDTSSGILENKGGTC